MSDRLALMKREPVSQPDQTARHVFLAHGWDMQVIRKLKDVLGRIGLLVFEWDELVARIGHPSPFTLEVVKQALDDGMVFVVLFSPDETVTVADHLSSTKPGNLHVNQTSFQARPNVLLEAGMAIATNMTRTVIVEVGKHRQMSDLDGLNVVRTQDPAWAERFAQRLKVAFENADKTLALDDNLLRVLRRIRPINRGVETTKQASPRKATKPAAKKTAPPKLAADPVNRCARLLKVFQEFGGVTSSRWRFDQNAPDYKVMKESEVEDARHPIRPGTRVYVQQHYESEYNAKVGQVADHQQRSPYLVKFDLPSGLADKSFHVMYLSKCEE